MSSDRVSLMSDLSKARFAWLLGQRGVPYCAEQEFGHLIPAADTRPDFYARPIGFPPFLAAVAGLGEQGPSADGRAPAEAERASVRRLNKHLRHSAWRIRPYKTLGVAIVLVLDGTQEGHLPLGPRNLVSLAGALEDRRTYVSALLVSLPREGYAQVQPPERERPMRARILHNPAAAVPLHLGIFLDPEDEHIGRLDGRWVDLRSGAPLVSALPLGLAGAGDVTRKDP